MYFEGILLGAITFIIIGAFHPIVIKGEYYFGKKIWWFFLVIGLIFLILSLKTEKTIVSSILGIVSFCSFWTIKELFEQEERVLKGWYPKNPKRAYKKRDNKDNI